MKKRRRAERTGIDIDDAIEKDNYIVIILLLKDIFSFTFILSPFTATFTRRKSTFLFFPDIFFIIELKMKVELLMLT